MDLKFFLVRKEDISEYHILLLHPRVALKASPFLPSKNPFWQKHSPLASIKVLGPHWDFLGGKIIPMSRIQNGLFSSEHSEVVK